MQRRLALGAAIAHEGPGLDVRFRREIGVCTRGQQDLDDEIEGGPICGAQGGMECGLSGAGIGVIDVRAVLEKKLTQPPVPVIRGRVQTEVRPSDSRRSPFESRSRIAVTSPYLAHRRSATRHRAERWHMPLFDEIEHQVGPPAGEPIEQRGVSLRDTHLTLHSDSRRSNPVRNSARGRAAAESSVRHRRVDPAVDVGPDLAAE